jgi:regulator of protease activity HflC (stomatin/prohibitin superfamily)
MHKVILGVFGTIGLFVLLTLFGSWYTIDQTERGVILRNGAITSVSDAGLHFKLPWIDSVVKISTQSHIETFDKMEAYSFDQQPAILRVSVNYHIDPTKVAAVYTQYANVDNAVKRLVAPHVFQQTKVVFGKYNAQRAIQDRGKLNSEVMAAIQKSVDGIIIVESVQIENIDFSKNYLAVIEQRMVAQINVEKFQQDAEREKVQAQITVTKANAERDAAIANATAQAESIRLKGEAEAKSIKARGDAEAGIIEAKAKALANNPNLIALIANERWDGKLPITMLPNSTLPMVNVGK